MPRLEPLTHLFDLLHHFWEHPKTQKRVAVLLIFVFLGIYYRIHHFQDYLRDPAEKMSYIMIKKILALALLAVFFGVGLINLWQFFTTGEASGFFETFYTILIFADILLVLIAQRYMPSFHAVFRNSGYVVATLFIRIALAAPPYYDAVVGLMAAAFALGVTYATNLFHFGALHPPEKEG